MTINDAGIEAHRPVIFLFDRRARTRFLRRRPSIESSASKALHDTYVFFLRAQYDAAPNVCHTAEGTSTT